jgi:hypothetical protein
MNEPIIIEPIQLYTVIYKYIQLYTYTFLCILNKNNVLSKQLRPFRRQLS